MTIYVWCSSCCPLPAERQLLVGGPSSSNQSKPQIQAVGASPREFAHGPASSSRPLALRQWYQRVEAAQPHQCTCFQSTWKQHLSTWPAQPGGTASPTNWCVRQPLTQSPGDVAAAVAAVLSQLKQFLPKMQQANAELQQKLQVGLRLFAEFVQRTALPAPCLGVFGGWGPSTCSALLAASRGTCLCLASGSVFVLCCSLWGRQWGVTACSCDSWRLVRVPDSAALHVDASLQCECC